MSFCKSWRVRPFDEGRVRDLSLSAGVPPVVAQLLLSRGVCSADVVREFLEAKLTGLRDPQDLPGVPQAAQRISQAIRNGTRITVYGDYDADGISGTAILVRVLRALHAHVDFYVPHRLHEGYGLNDQALQSLADRGTRLVISVDCGIASIDEAETARRLGLELIVTDHHEMGSTLPNAAVVVHPRLPETNYPFTGLCGAGVALKLAWAICRTHEGTSRVSPHLRYILFSSVGLAALGTVADVVPLVDENRLIVRHGLLSLKMQPFAGISALLEVTRLHERPQLASEDVAFSLAPRLNAAGRLGQAELGVELLLTDSPERGKELAVFLDDLNRERDSLERSIYLSAQKELGQTFDAQRHAAIVLAHRDWHVGVIGIVAGRIAERYQRPTILIALDPMGEPRGVGSGRSALGIDIHRTLQACSHHLISFGGHAAAVGLKVAAANLEPFRAAFCAEVARLVPPERRVAELHIDAEAPLPQLTLRTVDQIQQLAPFGQSNPRPVLCATGVEMDGAPRYMGEGDRHLSLKLKQHSISLRAVAFGQGEWAGPLTECSGPIDIAYRPVINEFRGRRSVELHLVDWRPTHTPPSPTASTT
jgi:single-stranded-DNA-specific exonuclease